MNGPARGFRARRSVGLWAALPIVATSLVSFADGGAPGPVVASSRVAQQVPGAEFADSARVDSLQALVSPDRIEQYRRRAADDDDPRRWYDLGAGLLLAGDWEGAIEPLERVVNGPDSEVAASASYNLGVAHAVGARPPDPTAARGPGSDEARVAARRARLMQARDAFRRVLRQDPGADDARWNLEVVDRWLERLGGQGGGDGGGGDGGDGGDAPREMTPEEVRRLLDAAASEERRVQEERFQRSRSRDPVAERNW